MSKIDRIVPSAELEPFYQGVDDFCKEYLRAPVDEEPSAKIFADPIESYAALTAWEVSIVDSHLFQRLRGIRQLGLSFLVYPTLGYSRFEHVIGVLARLKQVISHIKANQVERESQQGLLGLPTDKQFVTASIAALCHDLGHCIFSHVSEMVLMKLPGKHGYPSTQKICSEFKSNIGRTIPIAEILSVSIVTSPVFIQFLQQQLPNAGKHRNARDFAFGAAYLIMGLPIPGDPTSLFLAQLMSSGLDVDKLDYILREAHLSGISLGISLDWLLKKIHLADLPAEQVPEGLLPRIREFTSDSRFAVLALSRGGQFAFEEFCIARLALHEKIYLHQKIRAAEAFLVSKLELLPKIAPEFLEAHRWLYLPESIFEHPDVRLPTLPSINGEMMLPLYTEEQRTTKPLKLQGLLVRRELLHRAYCFGWRNAIAEPVVDGRAPTDSGTDRLMRLIQEKPHELLNQIQIRLREIRKLLGEEAADGDLEILVDPPRYSSIQQGHDTLYIEHPSRLAIRWTMPIDRIVEYYHDNRALGYVFSTKKYLTQVLLASERAAWDLFQVVYVQEGPLNSKIICEANKLRARLHEEKFYHDARPLQPVSDFLNTLHAQTQISKVAKKLALYESRAKKRVTPASVTTFIAQFPLNLQDAALEWLQEIEWIQPDEEIKTAFKNIFLNQIFDNAKRIGFCPLGNMTDSASHIAYKMRDFADSYFPAKTISIMPLNEALARKFDAYVFYDDNVNSGLQALNILSAWLGEPLPQNLKLPEDHVQTLDKLSIEEIRRKPLAFTFAVGTQGAKERLTEQFQNILKLDRNKFVIEASKILPQSTMVFNGIESRFQHKFKLPLRDFIKGVSKEIMISEGKSQQAADEKALGYNGSEAMIVFPYNCPTMTITGLWVSGKFQGSDWLPLVERGRRTEPGSGALSGEDA